MQDKRFTVDWKKLQPRLSQQAQKKAAQRVNPTSDLCKKNTRTASLSKASI
jgi:hypothetical protein